MVIEKAIKKEYSTRDLYEAAYLFSNQISLLNTYKIKDEVYFVFENEDLCLELRKAFWSYQGSVIPKKYSDALKNLKESIFATSSSN